MKKNTLPRWILILVALLYIGNCAAQTKTTKPDSSTFQAFAGSLMGVNHDYRITRTDGLLRLGASISHPLSEKFTVNTFGFADIRGNRTEVVLSDSTTAIVTGSSSSFAFAVKGIWKATDYSTIEFGRMPTVFGKNFRPFPLQAQGYGTFELLGTSLQPALTPAGVNLLLGNWSGSSVYLDGNKIAFQQVVTHHFNDNDNISLGGWYSTRGADPGWGGTLQANLNGGLFQLGIAERHNMLTALMPIGETGFLAYVDYVDFKSELEDDESLDYLELGPYWSTSIGENVTFGLAAALRLEYNPQADALNSSGQVYLHVSYSMQRKYLKRP